MTVIITDSTADFSLSEAEALDIAVVPLSINFGAESYLDGVEIDNKTFYKKLREADELPKSSQVNPETFEKLFRPIVEAGDDIVGIFISTELSGTCQSAIIAAEHVGGNIHIIDSRTATLGLNLLVREAVRLRGRNIAADIIAAEIARLSERVKLYAFVESLKYLKMGGRLTAATAAIGTIIGICPIVSVTGGKVESVGKTRGKKAAYKALRDHCERLTPNLDYPMVFGHADAPDEIDVIKSSLDGLYTKSMAVTTSIGSVVGTHAGPGAAGIAYISK